MKSVIHKYPIEPLDLLLKLPCEAKIIHFALQRDIPTIWVESPVGESAGDVTLKVHRVVTGGIVTPAMNHVGTWMSECGSYVEHIYLERVGGNPCY